MILNKNPRSSLGVPNIHMPEKHITPIILPLPITHCLITKYKPLACLQKSIPNTPHNS